MFNNDALQAEFEQNGYVVVPFFAAHEVQQLLELYNKYKVQHDVTAPVHSTSDTNKPELIREVNAEIKKLVEGKLEALFYDCHLFLSNFLVKEPGQSSGIPPHQDWTLVDENNFASVSVWCPLVDVDTGNGCLEILNGSHAFFPTLRCSSEEYRFAYADVMPLLKKNSVPVPIKAGQVLVYHHALIHGSTPNLSNTFRPVVVLGVIPNQAELYLFYQYPVSEGGRIEKFRMDSESLIAYNKLNRPDNAKSLGFIEDNFRKISEKEFLAKTGLAPANEQRNSLPGIFSIFKKWRS